MSLENKQRDPYTFVGYTIVRLGHVLQQRFEDALADVGLTARQFGVLAHLMRKPGMGSGQLARLVLITPQSMGDLLSSLEAVGYIERDSNVGRGKRIRVRITPHGATVLERAWENVVRFEAATTVGLGADETEQLNRLLLRMLMGFPGDGSA